PSTVLAFDDAAFAGIDPRVQVFALRRMNDLTTMHGDRLAKESARASQISAYYREYIHDSIHEKSKLYEKSDMLYAIIKSVPQLPVYTTRLIHMLLNDSASVREVTELAKEDPSLVSEILKTINSSYYNLKRKVSDLQYAIMYMGFFQVYQIVISDGMRKMMPNTPEFMGIHHHSVIISHLAFEICQLCDKRSSSIMSTISLLHDIGKSVILLIKAKNPKLAFFVEMLDAPKVGAMLLKEWNIPESVCETVRCQNYPIYRPPSELPPEYLKSIAFLYMAHVCHDYFQGETESFLKHPFIDEYLALLSVSGCNIEEFIARYVISNLKLKMSTFPQHVQSFLSKKIELNLPR
ncbi:MAG: HDOD domain-containing protein, partial [Syntrophobacteraceae bacterium]|nr:HDOD domain-containing protein [Syntrophobacteraceae bacterium]